MCADLAGLRPLAEATETDTETWSPPPSRIPRPPGATEDHRVQAQHDWVRSALTQGAPRTFPGPVAEGAADTTGTTNNNASPFLEASLKAQDPPADNAWTADLHPIKPRPGSPTSHVRTPCSHPQRLLWLASTPPRQA